MTAPGGRDTALVLSVPDVEPLVRPWRERGDGGLPAHLTLLTPFLPAEQCDDGVLAELRHYFAGVDGFGLTFDAVRRLSQVVYLHPRPSGTVPELATSLARRWPAAPPTGADHADVVAHLTVLQSADPVLRDEAAGALEGALPLSVDVAQAVLWTRADDGAWSERATFDLGPGSTDF